MPLLTFPRLQHICGFAVLVPFVISLFYWLKLFTTFFTVATVVLAAVYVGEICGVALVTVDIHAVIVGHVLYYAG